MIAPLAARLTRRQDPLVTRCRAAARGELQDVVLIDGAHAVLEALRADVPMEALIATAPWFSTDTAESRQLWSLASASGALHYEATAQVMDAVSPVKTPSGLIALASWSPASLTDVWNGGSSPFVVGLVDVQDPGNVGAVIRAADGLGASGVICIGTTASPGGWRAIRGAMGSTFRIPVAVGSVDEALSSARSVGAAVWATALHGAHAPTDLHLAPLSSPALVLLGNEGAGLSTETIAAADQTLRIPMRAGLESLNVSITAALILYEARRCRGAHAVRP